VTAEGNWDVSAGHQEEGNCMSHKGERSTGLTKRAIVRAVAAAVLALGVFAAAATAANAVNSLKADSGVNGVEVNSLGFTSEVNSL
jgi:hypothetical protein